MRQGFIAAAMLAASLFTLSVAPAANAADASKIGVIDQNTIFKNSTHGQAIATSLQTLKQQLAGDLTPLNDKVKAAKEALDKATPKNTKKLQQAWEDADKAYAQRNSELQQDFSAKYQNGINTFLAILGDVLQSYGKDNHYDLIMVKGPNGVAYASDAIDVSSSVTTALDKNWDDVMKKLQAANNPPAAAPTPAPAATTKK